MAALRGGADWIDLKEPLRGPLGAVDATVARGVVACLEGRAPVSAAAGELIDWPRAASRALLEVEGVTHLKLGLSKCCDADWRRRWLAAEAEIAAAGKELVAVIYADHVAARSPCPADVVDLAAASRCRWALLDTYGKSAGALGDFFDAQTLCGLLRSLRAAGKTTVVAGSLNLPSLAALPIDLIDMIAVRGAACGGDRQSAVSAEHVAQLRALLSADCQV
jgi:(5-formylfuran-3-yl)methyl phosphate synthase